jgi:hypothetical protein
VLCFLVLACSDKGKASFLTTPAYGRPSTCPEGAADPYGDGTPSSLQAKCSFENAAGESITRLGGQVLALGTSGSPGTGVPGIRVTVHRVEGAPNPRSPGKAVGHATTDAQGSYHMSAILPAGDYLVVVRAEEDGEPLAHRKITLTGRRDRTVEDVVLWLPVDQRLE